ncbi:flagellar basal body-associated FliL family protein [Rhodobacter sp. NTK016B]|uniref:flagellar basal body-associated FliL family protein n=1 Tax=Rhodobacter sp. NTK016B TaxID=2759676 RepID=UPI001A8DCAD8|nr:flagellar basal body-associated FliL family protein [Rhodobacter sp. NTK016B]MBN8294104.1 flagellar basal body-associated FliL family protein [Rhodobacter sp. NTK016B]
MASADTDVQTPEKKSKLPLIIGLVLALLGAGGGFFVTYSGMLDSLLGGGGEGGEHAAPAEDGHGAAPADAGGGHGAAPADDGHGGGDGGDGGAAGYVPLAPIVVTIGQRGETRHLRFLAQLAVMPGAAGAVQNVLPRIIDVLNIYLRALDPYELEEPAALMRLRAQMLRRVQIVTGPGMVNDLLIMEFVIN